MDFQAINPGKSISLFVKNILVFEERELKQKTVLPFFADGYPGMIFQETANGLWVNPHKKQMPAFFLYGQTIKPIELVMNGTYKLVVFQLFPFVLESFFKVSPGQVTDSCYDLAQIENGQRIIHLLQKARTNDERLEIISSLLYSLFQNKQQHIDEAIAFAIKKIIAQKGQVTIKELYKELHLTERTFERRFSNNVGVSAKQFARIIQFQQSLEQLTIKDYTKLSDIVYENGFADQSHFIKVFKAFTGKTPKAFTLNK